MSRVSVYRFNWWDHQAGENVLAPRFATLQAIQRVTGEPVTGTDRTVAVDDLDGNGFFPKSKVWLVEIFDVVSRFDGKARVSVPHGEYVMREHSADSYWLSGDQLPFPFELTLLEVLNYLGGKMRVVAGSWP